MKVLQATIRYYPAIGGVEEYVRNISERLTTLGHRVKVVTSNLREYESGTKIQGDQDTVNGIPVVRCATLPWRLGHYAIMPFMPLSILSEKVDLIHAHCFMYFPFDAAVLSALIRRVLLVVNPYLAELGPPSIMGRFYRRSLGMLAMSADAVVAISGYEKHLITRWGFRPKRVEVIPPGVDLSEFRDGLENIYEKVGLQKKKIVLFVGRLDRNKGADLLIRAMPYILKKVPEAYLVIVGPDCGYRQELESMIESEHLKDRVLFFGRLERKDVISAMKYATVMALPSRYEAFGIVLVEAMAAKTPVVATNHSAIPYIITDKQEGLLFPLNDYMSLARNIVTLIVDDKLRKAMVDAAWLKVKHYLTWEQTAKKMEDLYLSLKRYQ